MTSTWPTGSTRRARGARDSGTNSAVRTIAAIPMGTLTMNTDRQPTESTSTPPTTGPSAMLMPNRAPHTPIAWARSRGSSNTLRMIDIATGLSIDPPIAWMMRAAMSSPRLGATAHSSEPKENSGQAALEDTPTAEAVGRRPRQHQQAGDDQRVGVDRPLQPRQRGVKRSVDRRERDVDDRGVQADDEQAHRADAEDDKPRPAIRHGAIHPCGVGTHSPSILDARPGPTTMVPLRARPPRAYRAAVNPRIRPAALLPHPRATPSARSRASGSGTCSPSLRCALCRTEIRERSRRRGASHIAWAGG